MLIYIHSCAHLQTKQIILVLWKTSVLCRYNLISWTLADTLLNPALLLAVSILNQAQTVPFPRPESSQTRSLMCPLPSHQLSALSQWHLRLRCSHSKLLPEQSEPILPSYSRPCSFVVFSPHPSHHSPIPNISNSHPGLIFVDLGCI